MAEIWGARDEWTYPVSTQCECAANQSELDQPISLALILGSLINFAYKLTHKKLLMDYFSAQNECPRNLIGN
jgi:hypothetical protein